MKRSDFQGLIESIPDAMMVIDRIGQIKYANNQAQNLFGYSSDLIDQSVEILIPPRFRGRHSQRQAIYFADPKVRHFGEKVGLFGLRKDQTEFPITISLAPITIEDEMHVVATMRDATPIIKELSFLKNRWKWLVVCVIILHLVQGTLLTFFETAGNTTSTHAVITFIPDHTVAGLVMLGSVFLSLYVLVTDKSRWLLFFQLILLIIAGFGAGNAILASQFADKVIRSRPFIAADQIVYIILAVMYLIVLLEIYLPRRHFQIRVR